MGYGDLRVVSREYFTKNQKNQNTYRYLDFRMRTPHIINHSEIGLKVGSKTVFIKIVLYAEMPERVLSTVISRSKSLHLGSLINTPVYYNQS